MTQDQLTQTLNQSVLLVGNSQVKQDNVLAARATLTENKNTVAFEQHDRLNQGTLIQNLLLHLLFLHFFFFLLLVLCVCCV